MISTQRTNLVLRSCIGRLRGKTFERFRTSSTRAFVSMQGTRTAKRRCTGRLRVVIRTLWWL